jgi:hypothetical protein
MPEQQVSRQIFNLVKGKLTYRKDLFSLPGHPSIPDTFKKMRMTIA